VGTSPTNAIAILQNRADLFRSGINVEALIDGLSTDGCSVDDRSAGRCVSKYDKCESTGIENCWRAKECVLIDSCEQTTCDGTDQCCGLSLRECRLNSGCRYTGECVVEKELDICRYFETESDCKSEICAWDQMSGKCILVDD